VNLIIVVGKRWIGAKDMFKNIKNIFLFSILDNTATLQFGKYRAGIKMDCKNIVQRGDIHLA